jgi:hypothetical protein
MILPMKTQMAPQSKIGFFFKFKYLVLIGVVAIKDFTAEICKTLLPQTTSPHHFFSSSHNLTLDLQLKTFPNILVTRHHAINLIGPHATFLAPVIPFSYPSPYPSLPHPLVLYRTFLVLSRWVH